MKKTIRLTDSELKRIIKESVEDLSGYSVSHATLHPQHIANALCSFLKERFPKAYDEFAKTHSEMISAFENENDKYWKSEDSSYDLNDDLFNTMNGVAPEGHYFGSHPGDGSDFGFWKDEDEDGDKLDEAVTRAIRKYLR